MWKKFLQGTLFSGLLGVTAVLVVPGGAVAAPPACRASRPSTVGQPPGFSDMAWRVNNRGDVVGTFAESQYDQHTYLWSHGTTQEVGLPGSELTYPTALTDSGYILGTSAGPEGLHAPSFLWHRGTQTDLSDAVEPDFPHDPVNGVDPYVQGVAMNESGLVAGYETDRVYRYGVTWWRGKLTRIPSLGGTDATEPAAVNDAGLVAVSARLPGNEEMYAAVWNGRTLHELGSLGGPFSYAKDINAAGDVVGFSDTADGRTHAFLSRHGKMTDLGMPAGGTRAEADFINDRDQVVGTWRGEDGQDRVVVWDRGRSTDLGAGTVASGINERGQVVVWQQRQGADVGIGSSFIWMGGVRINLPGLVPGGLTYAMDINDRGQVVGETHVAGGLPRSVTWTVTCGR